MKVLLVTNQYIDIRKNNCYSDSALYGTLENIKTLGDLYIVASKLTSEKPSSMPLVCKLEFLSPNNVKHLRPLNRTIIDYIKNKKYNRQLLERIIPEMDLVVGYVPSDNADSALKIAHKFGKPFLSFLVGCPWDMLHNHHRLLARIMAPISFLTTRYTVKHSEYVHYVTTEFLQQRYPTNGKALGCSDTNLRELSIETLQRRLQKVANRKSDDEITLVTTANVDVRYKGHEYVIRAIAHLKKLGDMRYRYKLIGGGTGEYLRRLCKDLDVENEIIFCGRKTWEEVIDILTKADIYLQPSLTEGLPRSVVEAMSTALPCIGFNSGGIPELLETEFIVPRKDINGLVHCLINLQDTKKYQQAAKRNFQVAAEYEHNKLIAKIRGFFREIRQDVEGKNESK